MPEGAGSGAEDSFLISGWNGVGDTLITIRAGRSHLSRLWSAENGDGFTVDGDVEE